MKNLLSIPIFATLINFISAQTEDNYFRGCWGGMMGGMYGGTGIFFGWLFGLLVTVALILLVVWLIKQIQKK